MFQKIKIFKFSNSYVSLALIDGEVYEICTSFGGYGFFNAVPWDYDEDGTMDLLIASSWGSGMHRSEISVFNVKTKQSTIICTSIESGNTDSELYLYNIYNINQFNSKQKNGNKRNKSCG